MGGCPALIAPFIQGLWRTVAEINIYGLLP